MDAARRRGGVAPALEAISSLDEELKALHDKVDIHNFDYVPVPREEDEE